MRSTRAEHTPTEDCGGAGAAESGPHHSAQGFTLVELLVSLVILGVLVGIALNITRVQSRAYLAVMQSDLRNLVSVQETYLAQHDAYAQGNNLVFTPSADVTVVAVTNGGSGWSARVSHKKRTDIWCAVFVGNAQAVFAPAEVAGVINCAAKGAGGAGGAGGGAGGGGAGNGNAGNGGGAGKGKP